MCAHRYFFLFVFLLITIGFLPGVAFADEQAAEPLVRFVVFGHVYPDYNALKKSIREVNARNPDFVVFLGDTLPNHHESGWDDVRAITNQFTAPVYFVPGNHDVDDRIEDRDYFTKNIGPLYQTLSFNGVNILLLNTTNGAPSGNYDIERKQVDWIKGIYERNDSKKIIFMHHCLFSLDNGQLCNSRGQRIHQENNWNSQIVSAIQGETLGVFVGDVGSKQPYFSYQERNIPYYGVGFSPDPLRFPQHMLVVSVFEDDFVVTPVPIENNLVSVKSLEVQPHEPSFRERVPAISIERLHILIVGWLKKITLGLAISTGIFFLLSVFLFLKLRACRLYEKNK